MGTIFLLAVVAALSLIAGVAVLARFPRPSSNFRYALIAFAGGFLLSTTLLHLIPQVLQKDVNGATSILVGFFFVFFIQLFFHPEIPHTYHIEEAHIDGDERILSEAQRMFIPTLIALFLHSFFDGVLIGSAFITQKTLGYLAFSAIFVHKFPVGLTVAALTFALGFRYRIAVWASVFMGLATIIGAVGMELLRAYVLLGLGLSAGSLLFVATVEFMPIIVHVQEKKFILLIFVGTMTGALLSYIIHILV